MKLYNNIEFSNEIKLNDDAKKEFSVLPVPYLQNPPEIINVSLGRQLFVDDFLIESTNLERFENRPQINPNNPIFTPEKPWETGEPEREWEEKRVPFTGDSCKTMISWKEKESLAELKGRIIKIRFIQEKGELYSFWISKKLTGESGGYLAAGEHGKSTLVDN